ncbi:hypothetical protein [Salinibacterium sp. ZJ70]|uniref:hypothetical protein n=1 Tax=Salinibacterium sp. ZJ70 TaxID=2708084 RepID=UPI00142432F0|nr:hypothetical protein [Salinibacterium sp. ZJ70]
MSAPPPGPTTPQPPSYAHPGPPPPRQPHTQPHPYTSPYPRPHPQAQPWPAPPAPAEPRRRRGRTVAIVLLSIALAFAVGLCGWLALQLQLASMHIDQQQSEIEDQQRLIDEKTTFGKVMNQIVDEANALDGVPLATLVDWYDIESIATRGWTQRWDLEALELETSFAERALQEMIQVREDAATEASTNSTGTAYEATLDSLGRGFVRVVAGDIREACSSDVLGCVVSDDPYVVHINSAGADASHMNDWLRTGLAYHEFAHVLQFANPDETEPALAAFGGDHETMADCYALTFLDGWTLNHRVHIDRWSWWEVDMGYGYSCDDSQKQVVRDWVASLGVQPRTVTARG